MKISPLFAKEGVSSLMVELLNSVVIYKLHEEVFEHQASNLLMRTSMKYATSMSAKHLNGLLC